MAGGSRAGGSVPDCPPLPLEPPPGPCDSLDWEETAASEKATLSFRSFFHRFGEACPQVQSSHELAKSYSATAIPPASAVAHPGCWRPASASAQQTTPVARSGRLAKPKSAALATPGERVRAGTHTNTSSIAFVERECVDVGSAVRGHRAGKLWA